MKLDSDDIAAIGDEFERRLRKLEAESRAADDLTAIADNDGPLYRTRASVELLPDVLLLSDRSLPLCATEGQRQFVMLNCGIDRDGEIVAGARFGDGFAQADSIYTPALQGASTPFVHPVVPTGAGWVLDRTRSALTSDGNFPPIIALRGLTPAQELEWIRATAAHRESITGGWKAAQP